MQCSKLKSGEEVGHLTMYRGTSVRRQGLTAGQVYVRFLFQWQEEGEKWAEGPQSCAASQTGAWSSFPLFWTHQGYLEWKVLSISKYLLPRQLSFPHNAYQCMSIS